MLLSKETVFLISILVTFKVLNSSQTSDESRHVKCCPISKKISIEHELLSCTQAPLEIMGTEAETFFKCKCRLNENIYFNLNESLHENESTHADCKDLRPTFECLHVYPRMAIEGFNLIYHQWVNKEHCFNLCLKTNTLNGDPFDCKSFEHWHDDCSEQSHLTTIASSTGVFNEPSTIDPCKEYSSNKNKRQARKKNLCVLSNQTIGLSDELFKPNDAVTYYEIACKSKYIKF